MPNFSVNTNVGAFVALQNLSSTNQQLAVTQNRINTGLKVASTKDDSATYAIAQNLRADIGGLNAVKGSLDRASSTLDVAVAAAESMSDILITMKEKANAASDTGLDDDSREMLEKDFNKLIDQLKSQLKSAEFNGTNLLTGTDTISAILDADGTSTLSVANQNLDGAGGTLLPFVNAGASVPANWTNGGDAGTSAGQVNQAIEDMNVVLSTLGSASRQIKAQQNFTLKLSDSIETGIGNLVDADLAKESAKLQGLQTKQQLGLQALSIANQAPQAIMSLFRG